MIRALLAALVVLLVAAAPAQAVPLLSAEDATELADTLRDATAKQGVCYSWSVSVQDGSGGPSGVDRGSSAGVDRGVDPSCTKTVELQGTVRYTCDSCEAEDSSNFAVASDFAGAPTNADLEALGLSSGNLKNENGDVTLINLVGALPLAVASKGEAVAVTPTDDAAPAPGDVPTGSPVVPDVIRAHWPALVFFLLLTFGGIGWLISQMLTENVRRAHTRTEA